MESVRISQPVGSAMESPLNIAFKAEVGGELLPEASDLHPTQAPWCGAGTGHLEATDLAWGLPGSSAATPRVGSSPCSPVQIQVPVELGL